MLPIICGGTHYYIQHFLFPPKQLSLDRSREDKRPVGGTSGKSKSNRTKWSPPCPLSDLEARGALDEAKMSGRMGVLGEEDEGMRLLETFYLPAPSWPTGVASTSGSASVAASTSPSALSDPQLLALHRLLNAVDPAEAGRWHWRDGRKVRRGIERWWERQAAGRESSMGDAAPLEPERASRSDDGDQQADEVAGPAGERKRSVRLAFAWNSSLAILNTLGPFLAACSYFGSTIRSIGLDLGWTPESIGWWRWASFHDRPAQPVLITFGSAVFSTRFAKSVGGSRRCMGPKKRSITRRESFSR